MDSQFFERLRQCREFLGFSSSRAFSLHLGLNPGSWQNYESGKNLPGASVLHGLLKQGISLNWLFSGDGDGPHLGAPPSPSQSLDDLTLRTNDRQEAALGLGRLALLAAGRSNLQERIRVMDFILDSPDGVSLDVLVEHLSLKLELAAAILHELVLSGHVIELEHSPKLYKAVGTNYGQTAVELADKAQAVLGAIRFITRDIPFNPKRSVLIDGVTKVHNGQALIDSICSHIAQTTEQQYQDDGQSIRLVLAALVGDD